MLIILPAGPVRPATALRDRRGSAGPRPVHLGVKAGDAETPTPRLIERRPCTCRKCHPCWSGSVFVLVQHATEAVTAVDVQAGEPVWIGDRFGQRGEWPGVGDALMGPVRVIEDLELAQRL
jgi:hypothetical protein